MTTSSDMSPRRRAAIVAGSLAALGAGALVGWLVLGRGGSAPTPPRDAATVRPVARPEAPSLPPAQPGAGAETLAGAVYDGAGQAVAEAVITATIELGPGTDSLASEPGLDTTPAVVAVSGDNGSFVLVGLEPGRYRLAVDSPAIIPAEVRFVEVPGEGLRIVVARRVAIDGQVVDGAAPAADVEVSLTGEAITGTMTARTDDDGRFSFDELPEGSYQLWAAEAARAAPAALVTRLGAGPFEPVTLTMGPAFMVNGRVIDRDGRRGLAALVELTMAGAAAGGREPARFGRAAPDGSFTIEGVLPGRWQLRAFAPGYIAPEVLELAVGEGLASPTVELVRGGVIEGRVVDGDGVPVAGAVVSASGKDGADRGVVASADEHALTILRMRGRGGYPTLGRGDTRFVPRGELGVLLGPIPMPPPRGAARVRIAELAPAPATARDAGAGEASLAVAAELEPRYVTDGQGRFRITGLAPGRYRLRAQHADHADTHGAPLSVAAGERRQQELTMVPGVTMAGTVTDQHGAVVVGATVIADPAGATETERAERRLQAVTGRDGRYQLGPVAHDLAVRVTAVGHADVTRTIEVGELGPARVERREDFVLVAADARIRGRVRDPTGFAVRGATVAIDTDDRVASARRAVTDEHGWFGLDGLPPGTHRLIVEHDDYPALRVDADTGAEAQIALPFGGALSGRVDDRHTRGPVSGARLVATGPAGRTREAASGDDGTFLMQALAPGVWTVRAAAGGYVPAGLQVTVEAATRLGEITARDVRFELGRGATVAGTVRDRYGQRVHGAEVRVGEQRARTDQDGAFRLETVPTGEIELVAEKGDQRGSAGLALAPGETVLTVEIAIE